MGIEVIAGRTFEDPDMMAGVPALAVIDRAMAEKNWPGEDAIGKQFYLLLPTNLGDGQERPPALVIGVVENVRHASLSGFTRETVYLTHRTHGGDLMEMTIKATGDPSGLVHSIREEVKAIDPNLPITGVRSMHEYVADALAPTRFVVVLLGVFAIIAMTMAAIGLYGILAFSVRQRTYEMGVRIALGATRSRIMALVLRQGLQLTVLGFTIGVAGAIVLNSIIASMLFGVTATDPLTFAGIGLISLLVAVVASYVPASRATRVNPVVALRAS